MYQLKFKNPIEVRMGSPFNVADVELTGGFIPSFEGVTFQDKGVLSREGSVCYLVEWKTLSKGRPGFCVWRISDHDRSVKKSKIIEGCCEVIALTHKGVDLSIFGSIKMEKLTLEDFS